MPFLTRSLVGLFLLAVTLGLLALSGLVMRNAIQTRMADDGRPGRAGERVLAVNTITVEPRTVVPVLTTFGEVRSRRTLELRASASGAVVELGDGVEDGGRVERGQLLVRIDPTEAQTSVAVAQADLSDAEAELRDAERSVELAEADLASARTQTELRARALQRQRDLSDRGIGSAAAVEEAELSAATADQSVVSRRQSLASAEARVDQARTALDRQRIALSEAERHLAETEVRAEFSGSLSDVTVVEGRLVSQNEQLASLIDPDALEIAFRVSTPQYARLLDADGRLIRADLRISLDVNGYTLATTGTVSRESAAVGEGQTGRLLFARLDNSTGFRPGDFATVAIDEPPLDDVALVPAAAIDAAGTALVVDADDRLEVVSAPVLRRQGDDVIVPAETLDGRRVVAERSPLLGAGIKVRPSGPGAGAEDGRDATPVAAAAGLVELSDERRARLVAFVEGNDRMPAEARERVLAQLKEPMVDAQVIDRIESRMGG